ncbi:MAG: MFS transporter, partial [Pseudomonadales bacterium]|nr:MFS transporter [Pseudomonadales bacterium]
SIFPMLLERSAFMSAVALNAFIWQSTRMAMPALGGIVIAAARDTWPIFAASAVGFFVMFCVMGSIRIQVAPVATVSPLEQLREGVRFIWQEELFRTLLGLTFVGMFFALSYVQIMPVFADLLGSDERGYGLLLSAGGLGSVVGTLLIGGVEQTRNFGRVMLGSAALSVLALFAFAAATGWQSFVTALICAFLAAGFGSVFQISSMTVMQLRVPDSLRGRVMGIHTMGYSFVPLGGLFLGSLVQSIGAAQALVLGGAIYLAVIALVWTARPLIRELEGEA